MRRLRIALAATLALVLCTGYSEAGGKRGSSRGPGTGSSSSGTRVRSYTRSNGKKVESHRRSSADGQFKNNYSTKGNVNPSTGKPGDRISPPK